MAGRKARNLRGLLAGAFKLTPKAAVEFFRRKGFAYSWDHTDTWQAAHARVFTVAKVMRMDILQALRGEVDRSIAQGTSFQEFQNVLIPRLQAMGWWGKAPDPEDPAREVQLGSPHRLRTIFETNVQAAYQAGHWQQAQDLKARAPQVQYIAVLDNRTRPSHRALHGKVFSLDDPALKTIAPPNGYGCRCTLVTVTEGEMKREGLTVEPPAEPVEREVLVSRRTGLQRKVKGVRLKGGAEFYPDAGFDFNGAREAWQPDLEGYDLDVARKYVEGAITGPDFTRFFQGEVNGTFPVAVLDPDYQDLLGAKTRTALLSADTRNKNRRHHPEVDIGEWYLLQRVIQQPVLVVRRGEQRLSFTSVQGRMYLAAMKVTKDGKELYVTSYRRSSMAAARKERRGGEVLLDELGD